jgi:crotonobetaine/carnitine-CoA ligase
VIYTSGTTGPSKGVLVSSVQVHQNYLSNGQWTPDDRALIALPLFHMAGVGLAWSALMRGGSFAMVDSFRTQDFWDKVRAFGATNTTLLGVMCSFLLKAPPSPADRDHTLRRAMCVPLSDQHEEFTRRFGVAIYTAWNMTETSSPLFAGRVPVRRAPAAGRAPACRCASSTRTTANCRWAKSASCWCAPTCRSP